MKLASHKLTSAVMLAGLDVNYTFERRLSSYGTDFNVLLIQFANESNGVIQNIRLTAPKLGSGQQFIEPPPVIALHPGASAEVPFIIF